MPKKGEHLDVVIEHTRTTQGKKEKEVKRKKQEIVAQISVLLLISAKRLVQV